MDELLYLTDDSGAEVAFEVLDVVEWSGEDYAVLFPAEGGNGAVLLRIVPAASGEEETYVGVDEETMQAVFRKFRELHKDELGE